MDRRTLIGMPAGSLLVAPLAGRAQPAPNVSRIGYISFRPGPNEFEQAFKEGMKPLRVSGATKVATGLMTAEEVAKVVPLA